MAFFTFGRKYKTFEEWYAAFSATGLQTVVNKNTIIIELATKYLDLFSTYLNTPTLNDGAQAKWKSICTILSIQSFLKSIPDQELFGKSLNAIGASAFGEAINTPSIIALTFSPFDFDSLRSPKYLLTAKFLTGLGANIEYFLKPLQPETVRAFTKITYGVDWFENLPINHYPAEWGRGLGPNAQYFFFENTQRLVEVLYQLSTHSQEFGAALGEHAAPLANILFDPTYWRIGGAYPEGGREATINSIFNFDRFDAALRAFFEGLDHNITAFVDAMNTNTFTSAWLLRCVPAQLCLYVAHALRTPERCKAFGYGIAYSHSLYGAAAPDFIRILGKNATPLMNAFFENIPRAYEIHDQLYLSIGKRANEFVQALPLEVRQRFIRGLSNNLITPELIGAMQCPYCHQELESTHALLRCSACSAFYHNECAGENNNHCTTLACQGNLVALRRQRPDTPGTKK